MAGTVTVFSAHPAALDIRLYRMELWPESSTETRAVHDGQPVTIAGTRTPGAEVHDGFALTRGIDREFFEAWLKQNAQAPFIGLIHAVAEEKQDAR